MNDIERWRLFRQLLGYVENGSSRTVTIGQDDATNTWAVFVKKKTYFDESLDEALKKAAAENPAE